MRFLSLATNRRRRPFNGPNGQPVCLDPAEARFFLAYESQSYVEAGRRQPGFRFVSQYFPVQPPVFAMPSIHRINTGKAGEGRSFTETGGMRKKSARFIR